MIFKITFQKYKSIFPIISWIDFDKRISKTFIVVCKCVIQGKDLFVLTIIHAAQYVMYLYRPDKSIASLITVVGACKSYSILCLHKSPETNMKKIATKQKKNS